jgi:hypothetical protein
MFVALASRLIPNPFVGNNDLGRSIEPFEANGDALRGPFMRFQFPSVDEAMRGLDKLEYTRNPHNRAVRKSVGYSVGTTYS